MSRQTHLLLSTVFLASTFLNGLVVTASSETSDSQASTPCSASSSSSATPSFDISIANSSVYVPTPKSAPASVSTSVALKAGKDFEGKVSLSASVGIPGITATFDTPEVCRGNLLSKLTLVVGADVPAGEYTVVVQGVANSVIKNAQLTLGVGTGGQFDLVLGVGSLIIKGGVTDYQLNDQATTLKSSNLGRATPQLLTGAAFRLPFGDFKSWTNRFGAHPWYAFLSLKFSPQSSQTLNGYALGGSFKLAPAFSILAGYSLTPIQEPSPGFRAAAAQVVQLNPNVPVYQRFNPAAMLANAENAFDGFPLDVQSATGPTGTRVFAGDPTVVHYHGGFIIGVAIPISLKAGLGGGQK